MTRRPTSSEERAARTLGQMAPGTLGGRSRVAAPLRSPSNVGAALGASTAGGSGSASAAASGVAEHLEDASAAHAASAVAFTPAGSIGATDVQAAIAEVDGDVTGHVGDPVDAHDASAVSLDPTGMTYVTGSDVQAAVGELDAAIDAVASTAVHVHVGTWAQDAAAASQTAVVLLLEGGGRGEAIMPRAGSVTGVAVWTDDPRTAGTLTVDVTVDGVATGLQAVLDGTDTETAVGVQAAGVDAFTAGQRIGVVVSTDGAWAPAGNITVGVQVAG